METCDNRPDRIRPDAGTLAARALAVDFGGTLARPGPDPDGAAVAYALAAQPSTRLTPGFAAAFDEVHRRVRRADLATAVHTSFAEELRRAAAIDGSSIPDPDAAVETVFDAVPDAEVDADAAHALALLRELGLRCVLACDTQRPARVRLRTLAAAKIADYFDAFVLSSELGLRKPHPDFYATVVTAAACPAHEIVFVGDTLATSP